MPWKLAPVLYLGNFPCKLITYSPKSRFSRRGLIHGYLFMRNFLGLVMSIYQSHQSYVSFIISFVAFVCEIFGNSSILSKLLLAFYHYTRFSHYCHNSYGIFTTSLLNHPSREFQLLIQAILSRFFHYCLPIYFFQNSNHYYHTHYMDFSGYYIIIILAFQLISSKLPVIILSDTLWISSVAGKIFLWRLPRISKFQLL